MMVLMRESWLIIFIFFHISLSFIIGGFFILDRVVRPKGRNLEKKSSSMLWMISFFFFAQLLANIH